MRERAAGLDLRAQALDSVGRSGRVALLLRPHGAVVLLHLREKRVASLRRHVVGADDRERASEPRALLVAQPGIDPVERRERDDGVELRALRLPGLEVRGDDLGLGEVAARDRREVVAELDARDVEPARDEITCRLARAAADLEHTRARVQLRERHEVVEHLRRIPGPSAVVELCDLLEGGSQALAVQT